MACPRGRNDTANPQLENLPSGRDSGEALRLHQQELKSPLALLASPDRGKLIYLPK